MDKKIFVYLGMGLFLVAGMAATRPAQEEKPSNLRIIPRNIDEEQLDRVMNKFNKALGVACNYCHVKTKPGVFPVRADFASDEAATKGITRKMMRMTDKINRKYFNFENTYDFKSMTTAVISCKTCHQGQVRPTNYKVYGQNGGE